MAVNIRHLKYFSLFSTLYYFLFSILWFKLAAIYSRHFKYFSLFSTLYYFLFSILCNMAKILSSYQQFTVDIWSIFLYSLYTVLFSIFHPLQHGKKWIKLAAVYSRHTHSKHISNRSVIKWGKYRTLLSAEKSIPCFIDEGTLLCGESSGGVHVIRSQWILINERNTAPIIRLWSKTTSVLWA